MGTFLHILTGLAALALLVWAGWRMASRRRSLPCPAWLGWMVELDNPFTRANRAAVILAHLDLRPGMAALDAGCGPGRVTLPLARRVGAGGRVVAMDLQAGMLDRVRAKAATAGLANIACLQAGLGEGKLPKGEFDRALLVTVLGEIPDRPRAMQEIFEALKPGGLLAVTEVIFDPHFMRRRTVAALAQEAGFRVGALHGSPIAYTMILEKREDHG